MGGAETVGGGAEGAGDDMTPFYQEPGITIFHADCRDILPTLDAGSVDLVLTDPPYGVDKAVWDTAFPTFWIADALHIAPRVLCMSGNRALIEAGVAFGDAYRDCIMLYAVNGMTRSPIAFGNYIPVIAAGSWTWKARPNVLRFVVDARDQIDHPSPKPLAAMRALLAYYSEPGDLVLDPFGGSGTTARACKDLGRHCILIEREERYCEIAVRRLSQEVFAFDGAS